MATRSLISLYALLATSAVITQSAEAAFYSQPNTSNPIEASIQDIRNGSWSLFLRPNNIISGKNDQARSWKNGSGKSWKNGISSGKWKNGSGKIWENSSGWRNGGWRNGSSGKWKNGSGGFLNW